MCNSTLLQSFKLFMTAHMLCGWVLLPRVLVLHNRSFRTPTSTTFMINLIIIRKIHFSTIRCILARAISPTFRLWRDSRKPPSCHWRTPMDGTGDIHVKTPTQYHMCDLIWLLDELSTFTYVAQAVKLLVYSWVENARPWDPGSQELDPNFSTRGAGFPTWWCPR